MELAIICWGPPSRIISGLMPCPTRNKAKCLSIPTNKKHKKTSSFLALVIIFAVA